MTDYDYANARPYRVVGTGLKAPSSNWSDIACPWCSAVVRAYWWSISGGGKKCRCGAKHDSMGMTAQPLKRAAPADPVDGQRWQNTDGIVLVWQAASRSWVAESAAPARP